MKKRKALAWLLLVAGAALIAGCQQTKPPPNGGGDDGEGGGATTAYEAFVQEYAPLIDDALKLSTAATLASKGSQIMDAAVEAANMRSKMGERFSKYFWEPIDYWFVSADERPGEAQFYPLLTGGYDFTEDGSGITPPSPYELAIRVSADSVIAKVFVDWNKDKTPTVWVEGIDATFERPTNMRVTVKDEATLETIYEVTWEGEWEYCDELGKKIDRLTRIGGDIFSAGELDGVYYTSRVYFEKKHDMTDKNRGEVYAEGEIKSSTGQKLSAKYEMVVDREWMEADCFHAGLVPAHMQAHDLLSMGNKTLQSEFEISYDFDTDSANPPVSVKGIIYDNDPEKPIAHFEGNTTYSRILGGFCNGDIIFTFSDGEPKSGSDLLIDFARCPVPAAGEGSI